MGPTEKPLPQAPQVPQGLAEHGWPRCLTWAEPSPDGGSRGQFGKPLSLGREGPEPGRAGDGPGGSCGQTVQPRAG